MREILRLFRLVEVEYVSKIGTSENQFRNQKRYILSPYGPYDSY